MLVKEAPGIVLIHDSNTFILNTAMLYSVIR